jgi:hypothetical protein
MDGERFPADFQRLLALAENFHDKRYRDNYVAAHTRHILARQMRNFRGDLSQGEFGELIGKRQTVVSRLENPNYGAWQLRTMFEVARNRNVAVFARFVDFPTFLKYTNDLSDSAMHPKHYDERQVEAWAREHERSAVIRAPWISLPRNEAMLPFTENQKENWTVITSTRGADEGIVIDTTAVPPTLTSTAVANLPERSTYPVVDQAS